MLARLGMHLSRKWANAECAGELDINEDRFGELGPKPAGCWAGEGCPLSENPGKEARAFQ